MAAVELGDLHRRGDPRLRLRLALCPRQQRHLPDHRHHRRRADARGRALGAGRHLLADQLSPRDTDAELIAAARLGSPAAFRELVAMHQQAVRSFLRRALDDPADADDVAQETFLAAWSRLWRYRGEASFRSWLCAIAWKKALSLGRARGRERRREAALEAPTAPGACADLRLDLDRALKAL